MHVKVTKFSSLRRLISGLLSSKLTVLWLRRHGKKSLLSLLLRISVKLVFQGSRPNCRLLDPPLDSMHVKVT